ncbi:type II secretion system protein GspL [Legionella septentrionalis]|uniref:type II secretion system protein GspL n=1 Tax=Legionella septentrionalis TaxID=2498109 RepID=UPI000F8DAE3B|nr:type II secretion system protein GspL [Legionella septentrionalis]RUR11733.1 type II secretion system protein GspL [Legionella septentrionalis]
MATCFLFIQGMDDENCLSLRLGEDGDVDVPLKTRSFSEIKSLQKDARTFVILPTEVSSLYEVELPWLLERKARAAIPYALEEQLAQNVVSLHFAYDRRHYQNGRYLVGVIDKDYLHNLLAKLAQAGLAFDAITLDWFALKDDEACISETSLLIREEHFKGALSFALASRYLMNKPASLNLFSFSDSPDLGYSSANKLDSSSQLWIAKRLYEVPFLNFCQGEFQLRSAQYNNRYWYAVGAGLAGTWLVVWLVMNIFNLYFLSKENRKLDEQIAVIYKQFFPEARQVIRPKFRITQLLNSKTGDDNPLWPLLAKLTQAFNPDEFKIQQFRFQNQALTVTLASKNFAALEQLQQKLQQAGVTVKQTQAASSEQEVLATLELNL